ncbi:hypothetical protein [Viscerimonas tarda]
MYYEPDDCHLLISHNLENNAWTVDGEVAVEVIHSDSALYHSITDAFEVTHDMINNSGYGNWIRYSIPFDENTFPKNVTVYEASFLADSILAKPYLVVMSFPLKQTMRICTARRESQSKNLFAGCMGRIGGRHYPHRFQQHHLYHGG